MAYSDKSLSSSNLRIFLIIKQSFFGLNLFSLFTGPSFWRKPIKMISKISVKSNLSFRRRLRQWIEWCSSRASLICFKRHWNLRKSWLLALRKRGSRLPSNSWSKANLSWSLKMLRMRMKTCKMNKSMTPMRMKMTRMTMRRSRKSISKGESATETTLRILRTLRTTMMRICLRPSIQRKSGKKLIKRR